MFEFLKIQYQLGKFNNENGNFDELKLKPYVLKKRITAKEYEEITGITYIA